MSQKLIYITVGSEEEAVSIARTLVAERLAARIADHLPDAA